MPLPLFGALLHTAPPFLPLSPRPQRPCSIPRWGTAWSGVRLRASAQLINVEITKCVPWSFAALPGNGLPACCTSTDLEILPSLGWLQKKFKSVQGREALKQAISWRHQHACWVRVSASYLAGSNGGAGVVYCGGRICFSKDQGFAETFLPTFFVSRKSVWHPREGLGGCSYCFQLENKAQRDLSSELLKHEYCYLNHLSIQPGLGPR